MTNKERDEQTKIQTRKQKNILTVIQTIIQRQEEDRNSANRHQHNPLIYEQVLLSLY